MKKIISFLSIFSILSSFFLTTSVFAEGKLEDASGMLRQTAINGAGYADQDIGSITGNIINVALSLVGIIFLALMVYAGYLWMTAQGEESEIEKSKKIITSSIIGLILTLSAYAITKLVTSRFGG